MSRPWGEMVDIPDTESGIAAIEREQMSKPRLTDIEGPPLHQPSSRHFPPTNEPYPAAHFSIDALTLHTIQMLQHARALRQMIQNVHQYYENRSDESEDPAFAPPPVIPPYEGPPMKHTQKTSLPFLQADIESPFVRGIGVVPPEIDSASARQLLQKTVAVICAHAGFDSCPESVLEILTDVCHEYFLQITKLLRRAVDNEALHGATGFQDPVEQVFHEMGIGSMQTFHEFYQTRIIDYHASVRETCEQLTETYRKAINQDFCTAEELKSTGRLKEEHVADIQFPKLEETEEAESGDMMQYENSSMELGMGMSQETSNSLNSEEEQKWPNVSVKSEPIESRVQSLEAFDQDDNPSVPPHLGSDQGDIQDPGSVSTSDIMSPPPFGMKHGNSKKKRKR